jgi:class 3 adenylate cyclase
LRGFNSISNIFSYLITYFQKSHAIFRFEYIKTHSKHEQPSQNPDRREPKNPKFPMNEKFKERFNEAIEGEIPDLLDILKSHYGQIPSHFKGSLNQLTNEFFNQPNNFSLGGWKAKFLVLIGQFKFEIQEDTPEPPPSDSTNSNTMKQATKTLYIIFADLKGYGSNAGNNPLLAKVTDFFISLQNKYFADGKAYFFKRIGDGILVTGYSLIDMAQKAIVLRNEIKNHDWQGANFLQALNVRMALHTGEVIEHYKGDGTIDDVSGTAVIQAARLEPYVMVGEVFCSQIYADLLTQHKTHNLATINLGKHNLGKAHDTFELDIAVLFAESDKEMYEEYKSEKCKKHLAEKIQSQNVEQSEVAKNYDKGNVPPVQNVTNNITINQQGGKIGQLNTNSQVDNRGANFNL